LFSFQNTATGNSLPAKYPANRWFSEETHLSNHVIPIRRHQLGAKAESAPATFVCFSFKISPNLRNAFLGANF